MEEGHGIVALLFPFAFMLMPVVHLEGSDACVRERDEEAARVIALTRRFCEPG